MAVAGLEAIAKNNKTGFASGAFVRGQQLRTFDLPAVRRHLQAASFDLVGAAGRSQQQYRFPALTGGAPLLIDEGLRFPVSLTTALQTAAMYQGLDWEKASSRRVVAAEFFRLYCEGLLGEAVGLAVERQLGLDLALSNLVVTVGRGLPTSFQARDLGGYTGPTFPQPDEASSFKAVPIQTDFYAQFIADLLATNLRPLVAKLVELCEVKPEVLWDYAIETLLGLLDNLNADDAARASLLVHELDPGEQLVSPLQFQFLGTPEQLHFGGTIYVKRKCCEKFKKDKRCSSCPGNKKR